MGNSNNKNSFFDGLREARCHKILKKDIIDFLSRINNENLYENKNNIITQAEILLARSTNYVLDTENDQVIPFLENQIPPSYEQLNDPININEIQFRKYIKKVSFYFQYFLECK